MTRVTTPQTGCRFDVTWRPRDLMEPLHATETDLYHLRYLAYCSCGYAGPPRTVENTAAEDGADHAFPGWRTLPVMRPRPVGEDVYDAWMRWADQAARVYPPGWFDAGGPVRTERDKYATRHAPTMGPGGGYDMCARTRPYPASWKRRDTGSGQEGLFDTAGGTP
ncbi:DUF6349 family protein [Nocardiopsis synnemataformans]|uniref:DUF6349 family protein n=1 Tax=Nocardiopsis synnemataformans TaxID=61305 RepID=UPI003EB7E5D7